MYCTVVGGAPSNPCLGGSTRTALKSFSPRGAGFERGNVGAQCPHDLYQPTTFWGYDLRVAQDRVAEPSAMHAERYSTWLKGNDAMKRKSMVSAPDLSC